MLLVEGLVEEADASTDTSVLNADDVAAAYRLTDPELTSEEEHAAAMGNEQEWHLRGDGTLARGRRDRCGGDRGAAWGRP